MSREAEPQTSSHSEPAFGRRRLAGALTAVAVLFLALALVLSYAGRAVLRAQPFADRAVAALRDQSVQDDVADHLTNALVGAGSGDLATVRPIVRSIAGAVIGGRAFVALFRRGVLDAHSALVQNGGGTIFVSVADAGVLIQGALERFSPSAADRIGSERVARLFTLHPDPLLRSIVRTARRIYTASWLLAVVGVLLAVAALWISTDRRRTARTFGTGLVASGVVIVGLYLIGGAIAGQIAPPGRGAAARAIWHSFLGGLSLEALFVAIAGVVVRAAASEGLRPAQVGRAFGETLSLLKGGSVETGRQALLAFGLLVAGIAIILEPGAMLRVLAVGVGLYVVSRGAQGILWASTPALDATRGASAGVLRRARQHAPAAIALAAVGIASAVIATGGGDEAPAITPTACNGYVALCNRPLNDVSLAATHNSMASVTIPSWLFGQQDGTIADQLSFGIRGLLIDTYYGEAVSGRVRTDLESLPKLEVAAREIGAPAVDAALRIRSRLGPKGSAKREIFLCHGLCELGAITLASALTDLREFLVSNPGEVMVVINQDEGVAPADIAQAFEQAGLLDLVYRGQLGPFPTLRAMIDSGQRLVVMAENDAGDIPWYHLAYQQALQETPFRFTSAAQLTDPAQLSTSCRPNRGPATAPLLLLNNWVDTTPTPRASLAALVNARTSLLDRARACQRVRHRLPNLVAVDFFRRGDVLGVVDALNGVAR